MNNINIRKRSRRSKGLRYAMAKFVLKTIGWQDDCKIPDSDKFILIAVPHTSNWDLPIMLLISIVAGIELHWVAKDSLFKGIFGRYLRWLGGIPVNRSSRTNFTDQVVEVFNKSEKLIIVIAPEGTRGRTEFWKSGFYHIAKGAEIPIAFGFLDYGKKVGGIDPGFFPSGKIEDDFKLIRNFYKDKKGLKPENFGPIAVRSR